MSIPGNNDLTAIQLRTPNGKLTIFNIYNDCTHSRTLTKIRHLLCTERAQIIADDRDTMLWCGDFNHHHPLWDNDEVDRLFTPQAMREAEVLIAMVADEGMDMALPKGIPTLKHMVTNLYSRTDNVWCSETLLNRVLHCDVDGYLQPPCTDHLPIVTTIDIPQEQLNSTPSPNFRMADWDLFWEHLQENLTNIPLPTLIDTSEQLQQAAENLMSAYQTTMIFGWPTGT